MERGEMGGGMSVMHFFSSGEKELGSGSDGSFR